MHVDTSLASPGGENALTVIMSKEAITMSFTKHEQSSDSERNRFAAAPSDSLTPGSSEGTRNQSLRLLNPLSLSMMDGFHSLNTHKCITESNHRVSDD